MAERVLRDFGKEAVSAFACHEPNAINATEINWDAFSCLEWEEHLCSPFEFL